MVGHNQYMADRELHNRLFCYLTAQTSVLFSVPSADSNRLTRVEVGLNITAVLVQDHNLMEEVRRITG